MPKVGVIGIGAAAKAAFMPALCQTPDVQLYALHPRQERLDQFGQAWPLAGTATTLDDLLAHGIQTAVVITPSESHAQYVMPLLEAGVDVLCEKPMALRMSDSYQMADLAAQTGKILMIGFNRRYAPAFVQARESISSVEVVVAQKNKSRSQDHALVIDAIHVVDAMRWLCGGKFISVRSAVQHNAAGQEQAFTAQVLFDNGSIGMFVMHRNGGHWMERVEVYGGGQTAIVEYPDRLRLSQGERHEIIEMTPNAFGWSQVHDVCGFRRQIDHFFECVRTRQESLTSAADSLETMRLVDQIYREAGMPGLI